jgi:hypothetical protein
VLGDPAVEDALAAGQDLDVPAVLALALRRDTPTG